MAALLVFIASSARTVANADELPLGAALTKSYSELFELAEQPVYRKAEIDLIRNALRREEELCVSRLKQKSAQYLKDIEKAQKQLQDDARPITESQRHDLHCTIQSLREQQAQTDMMAKHAIPIAYDNRKAKLDLIEQWPAEFKEITAQLESGASRSRRWGDVEDIGFREIEEDQHKDIKTGQDAIQEMKSSGLIPPQVANKEIVDYVNRVARKVAAHSDLRVPLQVTVLNSKEINAFALPGGFLFIERGLLEAVDDESELAGVIGHEMSHIVARHGHKLMVKAGIANILLQAAQIAAVLFTGPGFSAYAIQYGFSGLGFALDLKLLGVSRDFELQADQLGIQYTWNSGYDPGGFVRFFDKMATTKGYVEGASWFYDHPPFYERMVEAEREIRFLPKKSAFIVETSEFNEMKKALALVTAKATREESKRPSLVHTEPGCAAPPEEYKAGEPIESICGRRSSEEAKKK
jgi:Zn-dependent protease with chaperone function